MLILTLALPALADEPAAQVHGWAEAGLHAAPDEAGLSVDMARLQARYEPGAYGGLLQVEAKTGKVELLDAVARVGTRKGPHLQAGQFKTPLSADFAVPAPAMHLPTRALLVGLAPQRALGVEGAVPLAHGAVWTHLGAYEIPDSGVFGIAAVDVELVDELVLHTAAAVSTGGATTGDLAVVWETGRDRLAIEGLLSRAEELQGGVALLAAHRFRLNDELELEPAVGWDTLSTDHVEHRLSAALNLHQDDWNLVESVSVEESLPEHATMLRAQLQAGF